MESKENKSSKFSSGLNIIMRIDNLWKNCASFKRNGQYNRWNDELDTIWLELARDIDEDDFESIVKHKKEGEEKNLYEQFMQFDEEMKKFLPIVDSIRGFKKPRNEYYKKREEQYRILMNKQLFLARLENKLGKGTSWGEAEDDWD